MLDGNSSSPPWWAMFSTRFSSQGFWAEADGCGQADGQQEGERQEAAHGRAVWRPCYRYQLRTQRCRLSFATCSAGSPRPSPAAVLRSTLRSERMPGITVETASSERM